MMAEQWTFRVVESIWLHSKDAMKSAEKKNHLVYEVKMEEKIYDYFDVSAREKL